MIKKERQLQEYVIDNFYLMPRIINRPRPSNINKIRMQNRPITPIEKKSVNCVCFVLKH